MVVYLCQATEATLAKRHDATRLLSQGLYLDDIAAEMEVSFQTVVRYMKLQVAEGALKMSDVFFGLKPSQRATLDALLLKTGGHETKEYYSGAAAEEISWDEANLFWSLRDSRISRGDMYEQLVDLEVGLHRFIRNAVMHPVKNKSWNQDDFTLVHNLLKQLRLTAEDRATPRAILQQSVRFERRHKEIRRSLRRNQF